MVPLTIRSASGTHRFTVEIARTDDQQQHGMMFRTELAPDRGMLFPYNPPQRVGFWMKNTLIPLDIIFIRSDGTIVRITTAVPHSETPVPSGEPVAAVLEIAGGRAAQLGIKEGDIAQWRGADECLLVEVRLCGHAAEQIVAFPTKAERGRRAAVEGPEGRQWARRQTSRSKKSRQRRKLCGTASRKRRTLADKAQDLLQKHKKMIRRQAD